MRIAMKELKKTLKKFDLSLRKADRVLKAITTKFGIMLKQKLNGEDIAELARATQHKLLNVYLELGDCYEEASLKFRALREEFEKAMRANCSSLKAKKQASRELLRRINSTEKPSLENIFMFAADIRNIFDGLLSSYTNTFETIVEVRDAELRLMRRDDKLSQALGKIESLFSIIESFQSANSNFKLTKEIDYLRRLKEERIRPYIR
ncbi:MAG: hypothetical protein AB1485_09280 [Candidatus Thermoplasmatota archaeon]